MKTNRLILCTAAITMLLLSTQHSNAQAIDSKFRLGVQATHFVSGLSGIMEVSDPWALQAILDLGADEIALRALNRFHHESYWNGYGFGVLGFWEDRRSDTGLGVGVGIGVEYDWRGLDTSLPPLAWNIELGASLVPDFDLDIGIGVHWKF